MRDTESVILPFRRLKPVWDLRAERNFAIQCGMTKSMEVANVTTIRATYTGGVLRPVQPLSLSEGETVEVTITAPSDKSKLSEDEILNRIRACKSYHEWLEVTKLLPSDDGGYDIVNALDENRRWSGERPLLPDEAMRP